MVEVFQPGASGPVFPHQLIRDALVAVDLASPPLTPASQSKTRYAAPAWGDDVLRMLVTGGPPVRGGGGMPQRIVISSRSVPALRTTGAG